MCLFPRKNLDYQSAAYRAGLTEYDCGSCPECLAKRARFWALRAVMEARISPSMMITLTYDQEIRDQAGNVIGERLPDLLKVDKRDAQLFIKRLRKYFGDRKIKYILTAEYGKSTHRPHYHALIFGALFDDLIFKKRSKRGNIIFSSPSLSKIWGKGICSVDSVNATTATARYCTKYAAKDGRSDDTFMLFSRGIGDTELLRCFNGKSYIIDGQEYPIPRLIWQKVITTRYRLEYPKYRSLSWCIEKFPDQGFYHTMRGFDQFYNDYLVARVRTPAFYVVYSRYARTRSRYRDARDADLQYQSYIAYWKNKVETSYQKDPITRILELDTQKYGVYKSKALIAYAVHHKDFPLFEPRSSRGAKKRCEFARNVQCGKIELCDYQRKHFDELVEYGHLPFDPCHITANDTTTVTDYDALRISADENGVLYDDFVEKNIVKSFESDFSMLDSIF